MNIRINRRRFVAAGLTLGAAATGARLLGGQGDEAFVCPPCGCAMDDHRFAEPGTCPACQMTLMPAQERSLGLSPATLAPGAGHYRLPGDGGRSGVTIQVRYYLPPSFNPDAPVLLVLPGSGRNADAYRNTWLAHSRACGRLVAALEYAEDDYDFAAYHMGGLIKDLTFRNLQQRRVGAGQVMILGDEDIAFTPNPVPSEWLYADFDRVFEHLVAATGARAKQYDVFGHSAGAQIAHRLVLCRPQSPMRKVIAANAGFYTLPTLEQSLPTGLADSGLTREGLRDSLQRELIVLLGERDDGDGAGGTLLHTPRVDAQGLGRRQRGHYFFAAGQALAAQEETSFAWQVHEVPGVGHDFRAMSAYAASFLGGTCSG